MQKYDNVKDMVVTVTDALNVWARLASAAAQPIKWKTWMATIRASMELSK